MKGAKPPANDGVADMKGMKNSYGKKDGDKGKGKKRSSAIDGAAIKGKTKASKK